MADDRLRRINIPIPNPALADWLKSGQCRAAVEEVTAEIFVAYQNSLPVRTGNLRRQAYYRVGNGGWGPEQDRWFGWVGNRAPYAAVIEYGSRRRGISGQGQLRRAAHLVAGGLGDAAGVNIPGLSRVPEGRGSKLRGAGGRFVRNPLNRD